MGDPDAPLLRVTGLCMNYGGTAALTDASFDLVPGELVALVGRNGAGKSTLLRTVAAWTAPASGDVHILGASVRGAERSVRRHALFVPDTPPFWDDLTAWEHLQFIADAHRLGPGWGDSARELLVALGLEDRTRAFPSALSRGMRTKLALAMALLVRPRLLLLDEPFGPLDPQAATTLWRLLLAFRDAGNAVLVTCHQWPAGPPPDRLIVLESGRVAADGPPERLLAEHGLQTLALDELLAAVRARNPVADE